jgi:cell shape-determining protein MreC
MNNSKLVFLPPLLLSILLFTLSNLKLGIFLNQSTNFILSPLTIPVSTIHEVVQNKIQFFKSLSDLSRQSREQKVQIAHLIWENETLKQAIKDTNTETLLKGNYQKVIPVKISQSSGKTIATSTQPLDEIKPGMPAVSGNILLGIVTEVNDKNISIISLEEDLFPAISIRGALGPKGVFKHANGINQIINVPSQTPLILGDFILSEPSEFIPPNLLIGKITKLLTTPQEPIQKAEINIYESLQNSPDNVVIIVKP